VAVFPLRRGDAPHLTPPVSPLSRHEFENLVAAALDEVPDMFREALDGVAVVVEDENREDPDIYGLYHGVPLTDPEARHGHPPPRIAVYMKPLAADFPHETELIEEIRITVLHEVGHHMGLDEDRLDELGFG
jgi:predicted Zn-dependent protease with MMP-like domain